MPSEAVDIVNLGPQPIRVKFYEGSGEERKGDTVVVPAGGLAHGAYPAALLNASHFKSLCKGPNAVLKTRTRVVP